MKGLRASALLPTGALLLLVGLSCLGGYLGYRHSSGRAEVLRQGEQLADAFGAALSPHLDEMDRSGVEKLVGSSGSGVVYSSIAVLGKSGRILAAEPSLPSRGDLLAAPPCQGCHDLSGPLPGARIETLADGDPAVRVFRPLARRATCHGCHGEGEEPLGFLFLEMPVAGPMSRLRRDLATTGAAGLAALILLLVAGRAVLMRTVVHPAERVLGQAGRVLGVAPAAAPGWSGWGGVLAEARPQRERTARKLTEFGSRLHQGGDAIAGTVDGLQAGIERGVRAAHDTLQALRDLGRVSGEARASLDAIAGSTSDNSASLIQLSASVDEVANNADQLAQHVATTAAAVLEMVESVARAGERLEVLARETETTAVGMGRMEASTRQIESNARETNALGEKMAAAAREGVDGVEQTIQGIHESFEVIQETARAMAELAQASQAIGGVVKIINEINDKTKLLALNAAIIAAQAGEHGKSFSVVAHEIKNLSDRTALSTGEISRIVGGIQERVQAVSETVSRGKKATARSVKLAEGAGASLAKIRTTAELSHTMAGEILRATEVQASVGESVTRAMEAVNAMVDGIRDAAREHHAQGDTVGHHTEVMRDLTEQVKLATAEQAEVSRYLSEAIAAIDHNLQSLVAAFGCEREAVERIQTHAAGLESWCAGQRGEPEAVRAALAELAEEWRELVDGEVGEPPAAADEGR